MYHGHVGNKRPFQIPWTRRTIRGRIERLRHERNTWEQVSEQLNKFKVFRPGKRVAWTGESARAFYARQLPRPETRAKRRVAGLPLTRAECIDGPRPCPWVACRHHLALEAAQYRSQIYPRTDDVLDGVIDDPSCSLDYEYDPQSLNQIALIFGVDRSVMHRVFWSGMRQVEARNPDVHAELHKIYHWSRKR